MNFLTLPSLDSTIAIWSGGGSNISYLKNAACLLNKRVIYWGDINEQGFQILHQLRVYYSNSQSVMMDQQTFEQFRNSVNDARNRSENLNLLTKEEEELFQYLKTLANHNRPEQEKISQVYTDAWLNNFS